MRLLGYKKKKANWTLTQYCKVNSPMSIHWTSATQTFPFKGRPPVLQCEFRIVSASWHGTLNGIDIVSRDGYTYFVELFGGIELLKQMAKVADPDGWAELAITPLKKSADKVRWRLAHKSEYIEVDDDQDVVDFWRTIK